MAWGAGHGGPPAASSCPSAAAVAAVIEERHTTPSTCISGLFVKGPTQTGCLETRRDLGKQVEIQVKVERRAEPLQGLMWANSVGECSLDELMLFPLSGSLFTDAQAESALRLPDDWLLPWRLWRHVQAPGLGWARVC